MFKRNRKSRVLGEPTNDRLFDGGSIERLEDRMLLAGNVTVAINGAGDLIVQGDGDDNVVKIEIHSDGFVEATPFDGTTVDDSGLAGSLVTGDVTANMRGGDDQLYIVGPELSPGGGWTQIPVNDVNISSGSGNDLAFVGGIDAGVSITGDVKINSGSGNDYAAVNHSAIEGSVLISGSGGNDFAGLWTSVANEFEFRGGAGDDTAMITESGTFEQMELILGGGDNSVTMENSAAAGLRISSNSGNDTVDMDLFNAKYSDVTILTGGKNDSIDIDTLSDGGELQVRTAGGDDSVRFTDAEFETSSVSTAGGDDEVNTRRSAFGESQFTMGGGDDELNMYESSAFGNTNGNAGEDFFSYNLANSLPDLEKDGFEFFAILYDI